MTNTYLVAITRWFPCPTEEAFDAWAEDLSGAWIQRSGLSPLIGEFRSDDRSYTFRKAVDAGSPWEAIQVVGVGVHRALAHLGLRGGVRVSPAIRVEVDIDDAIEDLPVGAVNRTGVGE